MSTPRPPPRGDRPAAGSRKGLAKIDPALVVVLAGVCAALHVGKLPPALPALQQALGISLVQAGFLLSLVQLAGMSVGVLFGMAADALGLRRSMLCGLLILAAASGLGGAVHEVPVLMLLRACEGFGFLLVALPAPGLIRQLVAPQRLGLMLSLWSAYMPFATALALLLGPPLIGAAGWQTWWWGLGALTLAMALWLARAVPDPRQSGAPALAAPALGPALGSTLGSTLWRARLRQTLALPGIWYVAIMFALYSGQWLAVIGFLPVIATQAGLAGGALGALTAFAAGVNIVGNLAAGRILRRGMAPATLLKIGFLLMGLAGFAGFVGAPPMGLSPANLASAGLSPSGLSPELRYLAVLLFSLFGGVIPATLFALAVRLAPSEATLATTVGWVQQWSAFGQFALPPVVAWLASRSAGWQWTWLVTCACSALAMLLAARLGGPRRAARP